MEVAGLTDPGPDPGIVREAAEVGVATGWAIAGPGSSGQQLSRHGADGRQDVPPGFVDVFEANEVFAASFTDRGLPARAARGLAIVTCMDSRIDPLAVVGMAPGDAKILRNAGARVTEDVLRTLVLATYLLGVERVLVMPHSKCRMATATEAEIHALIAADHGVDTRSMEFRTIDDLESALARDLQRIRSNPFLPHELQVAGAVYDVDTGRLHFSH
jgi:carbonic anhydrase